MNKLRKSHCPVSPKELELILNSGSKNFLLCLVVNQYSTRFQVININQKRDLIYYL